MVSGKRLDKKRHTSSITRQTNERVGLRFGRLIVLSKAENDRHNKTRWNCVCDCGVQVVRGWAELRTGDSQSCGCLRAEMRAASQKYELVGQRFGKLVVQQKVTDGRGCYPQWTCLCDCGNSKTLQTGDLVKGRYNSCGCQARLPKKPQDQSWDWRKYRNYKDNAKKDNRVFELSFADFTKMVTASCVYCGNKDPYQMSRTEYKNPLPHLLPIFYRVGVDRINSAIGYTVENCVPCCRMCNKMKMEWDLELWKAQIRRIYDHLELGRIDA